MICLGRTLLVWCVLSPLAMAANRLAEFDQLSAQYDAAIKEYYQSHSQPNQTTADEIKTYEGNPLWQFLPKFLALAQAQPDDEAAYKSCIWVVDRCGNVGNWQQPMFAADQQAWKILALNHTGRDDLPLICLRAVQYIGPAREQFLRDLRQQTNLSCEQMGFATLALAELLFEKQEACVERAPQQRYQSEFARYLQDHKSPEFGADLIPANADKFKAESLQLFHEVQNHYANVPVTISAPRFRDLKTLGEKAEKSIHALESLSIGAVAPNITGINLNGKPLNLSDYHGQVVVLSFWFTGCGPCMAMVPSEQQLVEKYQGQPFALLGICTDQQVDEAQKTATEHHITWPCWFDGSGGPIASDYNVLHWPTIYVLDQNGKIAAQDLRGDALTAKIAELIGK